MYAAGAGKVVRIQRFVVSVVGVGGNVYLTVSYVYHNGGMVIVTCFSAKLYNIARLNFGKWNFLCKGAYAFV